MALLFRRFIEFSLLGQNWHGASENWHGLNLNANMFVLVGLRLPLKQLCLSSFGEIVFLYGAEILFKKHLSPITYFISWNV